MSWNLDDVLAGVQARGYTADNAAQQLSIANSIMRRLWVMRRWPFLRLESSAVANAGDRFISVGALSGTDSSRMNSVRYSSTSGDSGNLAYLPTDELLAMAKDYPLERSTPQYWTIGWNGMPLLYFFPAADRQYTIWIESLQTEPSGDFPAGTPLSLMPERFREAVIYGTCADLAARQRDWSAAGYWRSQYQDVVTELIRTYAVEQTQSPREVGRWTGWEDVER